jgi:hypothetical protein
MVVLLLPHANGEPSTGSVPGARFMHATPVCSTAWDSTVLLPVAQKPAQCMHNRLSALYTLHGPADTISQWCDVTAALVSRLLAFTHAVTWGTLEGRHLSMHAFEEECSLQDSVHDDTSKL